MTTATRVANPGDSFESFPAEEPERLAPTYFDARIPDDIVDRTRRAVRERRYDSYTEESETIRAVDDALTERVRASENYQIENAARFLETNQGRVADALAYTDKLEDIRRRLEAGEDTETVATEYRRIEREIRQRELPVLNSLAGTADKLDANLDDPVGHFQRVLSLQPLQNWQPLKFG